MFSQKSFQQVYLNVSRFLLKYLCMYMNKIHVTVLLHEYNFLVRFYICKIFLNQVMFVHIHVWPDELVKTTLWRRKM